MVERASDIGSGASSCSLTSLIPRQVMLENCIIIANAGGSQLAEKKSKRRSKREREEKGRALIARSALLRAVAAFLESNGFTRTLAALRSEAQLEINGETGSPVLNLDEIIFGYLELSKDPTMGGLTGASIGDAQDMAPMKEEGVTVPDSEETICKKRKKVKHCDDAVKTETVTPICGYSDDIVKAEPVTSICGNLVALPNQADDKRCKKKHLELVKDTAENQLSKCNVEPKGEKRKKSKKVLDETNESAGKEVLQKVIKEKSKEIVPLHETETNQLDESNIWSKEKKKKKKSKLMTEAYSTAPLEEKVNFKESGDVADGQMLAFATENGKNVMVCEDVPKSKDKREKKHNLIVGSPDGHDADTLDKSMTDGVKKRKRVCGLENDVKECQLKDENVISSTVAKKEKRRKLSDPEEAKGTSVNDAAIQATKQKRPKKKQEKETTQKLNDSLPDDEHLDHVKGRETEKTEENSERLTHLNRESQARESDEVNLPDTRQSEIKEQGIDEDHGKNESEKIGSLKLKKTDAKSSAEPKTANAFQRVKIDQVKFADERLQDNSYWAKDGAEAGYGAKAQGILGQVRGRDFRHEKTKKKRGSYRGGQIDFQSYSVKFKYSDDE